MKLKWKARLTLLGYFIPLILIILIGIIFNGK